MSASGRAGKEAGSWFVEADHVSVTSLARQRSRARVGERRAKIQRIVTVSALFAVLLSAGVLIGGQSKIDPLLRSAMGKSRGTGDVVYAMPDGIFCRHMSFDNVTAQVI